MLAAALVQNVGNFGFHAAASQLLGPSRYGAVGALLALTVALSIPLGALQAALIRAVAEADTGADATQVFLRVARLAGTAGLLVSLCAPLVHEFLRLGSMWQAVLLGPYVMAAAAAAAGRGAAIGRGRVGPAAASIVGATVVRLAVGIPATHVAGLTGALVATIVAELVGAAIVARAALSGIPRSRAVVLNRRDMTEAAAVILGVFLLGSVDLLLARHYLGGASSGVYVAGGTAARAALFLPQALSAVAMANFIRHVGSARNGSVETWHALRGALTGSVVLCVGGALGVALLGTTVLAAFFGIDSPGAGSLLVWLSVGTVPTAIAWLVAIYHLAQRSRLALLPWIGVVAEVLVIVAWHDRPVTIARAALGALALSGFIAVLAVLAERRRAKIATATQLRESSFHADPNRLRILVYTWRDLAHSSAGGAEVYLHEVARRWAAHGHRVTLFCASVPDRPGHEIVDGYTVVRRGSRFTVYREARRFWWAEGRGRYDLVVDCINTKPFNTVCFVREAPVVALAHQVAREVWWYEAPFPASMLGRFVLEPLWLRRYRQTPVLTISRSSRDALRKYGLTRVSLVPEGVEVAAPQKVPEKAALPTLLFCGRLVRSKRPNHAIAAFKAVRDVRPDARLIVIGTGPMEGRLRKDAPAGVEFMGRVSNTEKYTLMATAHALVATSVREGWGLTVSEAAALGTPTVAYDVPGLCDSVTAAGGRLSRPCPDALAAALIDVLPGWITTPPAPLPWGGAASWDEVAAAVLDAALAAIDHPIRDQLPRPELARVTSRPISVSGGSK